jgi:uncharacterized glyoxalase superfamily protein PhnB
MIKRIHSTLFYAQDLNKTAKFYEQLGFEVQKTDDAVRVILGDFRLAFIDENKTPIQKEATLEPKGIGVFTYIEVEDVDKYYLKLKEKGITTSSEPKDWPWGKREFAVKDLDGYKLVFYSPIKK